MKLLDTLADDVDTAIVTLGSGGPGIWPGSSCGMSIGGKVHHTGATIFEG